MDVRDPLLFSAVNPRLLRVACHVDMTTRRFEMRIHARLTRSTAEATNTFHFSSRNVHIATALHLEDPDQTSVDVDRY